MSELDDIARARFKRCAKEIAVDRDALQEAIRECAVATLQYENAFDFAASMICSTMSQGFALAEETFNKDISSCGHDEIHAMAGGLVRKMINDVRDEIELDHDPECPDCSGEDEPS